MFSLPKSEKNVSFTPVGRKFYLSPTHAKKVKFHALLKHLRSLINTTLTDTLGKLRLVHTDAYLGPCELDISAHVHSTEFLSKAQPLNLVLRATPKMLLQDEVEGENWKKGSLINSLHTQTMIKSLNTFALIFCKFRII